jgi:hypothetical protein
MFEPLNPVLFARLESYYGKGEVEVVAPGEAMEWRLDWHHVEGQTEKVPSRFILSPGEEYKVRCKRCNDHRARLQINHMWGVQDAETHGRNLWLLQCWNEQCYTGYDAQKQLYDTIYALHRRVTVRQGRTDIRTGAAVKLRKMDPPGTVWSLEELTKKIPEHQALSYLAGRGFDPIKLSRLWAVGYCLNSYNHFAADRIFIPIHMKGMMVGYQTRYIGDSVNGVPFNKAGVPKYWCVPVDHEMLTRRGWKKHDQLIIGEEVLAYDNEIGQLHWENLKDVHVFPFDGELLAIKRKKRSHYDKEFLFTEEHSWPVHTQSGHRKMVLGRDLNSNTLIPQSGEFADNESILSPRHAAILGWLITDGTALWSRYHWMMMVYQSEKKHLQRILDLLGTRPRTSGNPGAGVWAVPVPKEDRAVLRRVCPTRDDLLGVVCRLSREAAEEMWQAMCMADGSVRSNGGVQLSQYLPSNKLIVDVFQILSILTGRSASISESVTKGGFKPGLRIRMTCCVGNGRPLSPYNAGGISRQPFKGHVWCPETPTGTWVMRHNGHVIMTGNTCKGMPRRLVLYNGERAMRHKTLILVEGPADCWNTGLMSAAILGKTLSPKQVELIINGMKKHGNDGVVVVMLDPKKDKTPATRNKPHHIEAAVEKLWQPLCRRIVPVYLPEDYDPGNIDREWCRELIREVAARKHLNVTFAEPR